MLLLKIPVSNNLGFGIQQTVALFGFDPGIIAKLEYAGKLLDRDDVKKAGFEFRYSINAIFVPEKVYPMINYGQMEDEEFELGFHEKSPNDEGAGAGEILACMDTTGFTECGVPGYVTIDSNKKLGLEFSDLFPIMDYGFDITLKEYSDVYDALVHNGGYSFHNNVSITFEELKSIFNPVEDYDVKIQLNKTKITIGEDEEAN